MNHALKDEGQEENTSGPLDNEFSETDEVIARYRSRRKRYERAFQAAIFTSLLVGFVPGWNSVGRKG